MKLVEVKTGNIQMSSSQEPSVQTNLIMQLNTITYNYYNTTKCPIIFRMVYIYFVEPCKNFRVNPGWTTVNNWFNTSNEDKCPILSEFWIYNSSQWILERAFVRSIIYIRNEMPFSEFMGNESECGTNKLPKNREAVHTICFPADWFISHEPRKRHSFLNCT